MAYNPNKLGLPQLSFYPQQSGRRGPYKKPVKPESLSWLERMYGDRGDVGGWLYGGNVPQTPTSTLGGFDASSLGRRINELGSSRWQDTVQGKALGGRTVNEPASRISNQVSVGHNYDVWVKAHNAIMDATQNMPVGGDELRKKWLANNPRPAPPQTFPTSDGTSLADPANVITTPPTETAYRKLAELEIMPEYLRDQYAKIAQSGIYGKGGMYNILSPMERAEESVLQSIEKHGDERKSRADEQAGMIAEQAMLGHQAIQGRAAQQRRAATRSLGYDALRPGQSGQRAMDAMIPYMQQEAGMRQDIDEARRADQWRIAEDEQNYWDAAKSYADQMLLGQGTRRGDLMKENIFSQSGTGLPGLMGTTQFQGDLLGNRYWDLTDPMQKQYSYQTGLMGLGHQYDLNKMGMSNYYQKDMAQYQSQLKKDFEQWMSANNLGQYQDPEFMEYLMRGFEAGGDYIPGK